MIKVTSKHINGDFDSNVTIFGPADEVLFELDHLFYSIITSNNPEAIHAVINHYLPEMTIQIQESISKTKLANYLDMLRNCTVEDLTGKEVI